MPITIRQRLMNDLDIRLATITGLNGFTSNLGNQLTRWRAADFEAANVEALDYRDTTEEAIQAGTVEERTLSIVMDVKVKGNTSDDILRAAIGDISQAVYETPKFSTFVYRLTPMGTTGFDIGQANEKFGSATLEFDIIYKTTASGPFIS